MEALSTLSSCSVISTTALKLSNNSTRCPAKKVDNMIYCQSSGTNVIKSSSRSSVIRSDHSTAFMEAAGSLVLSPNSNSQAEIKVKDLVPYERHDDGIGITKFLRGKAFLITGATGFLGKGYFQCIIFFRIRLR